MAFKRTNLAFLKKAEEQRKEEVRQRKATERQQKRNEKMRVKVEELERKMHISQSILKCVKAGMDTKSFAEEELKLYMNTLKWIAQQTEDMKAQLFNITGEASYLIDIDSLYAGIRQIKQKRSSEAGS